MTTYTACYVNSQRHEALKVINHLNAVGGLKVNYLPPPADLSLAGIRPDTQLFLVDWELDRQGDGVKVDYKGGTFARRIRDRFLDTPIALTTNQPLPANRRRFFVESYLFDAELLKKEMLTSPKDIVAHCVSLITGYQKLTEADKTWAGLMDVLQVKEEDEEERIREAAPPLLKVNGGVSWHVPEIAKWIQEVLLTFPGVLYDPLHAATYLGLDVSEFLSPDIQQLFREARYTGALSPVEGRWWKYRLFSIADDVIFEADISKYSIHEHFGQAFTQSYGRELQLSECVYSKKKPAPRVCYVLKKPVRIEYSLLYQPDNRPRVMDVARVSFTAIRTSDDVFDEYFPLSSRHLADQIKERDKDEL